MRVVQPTDAEPTDAEPTDAEPTVDVYHQRPTDTGPALKEKTYCQAPPDRFDGEPQTWDALLVSTSKHDHKNITHMVIWGEIPPDLGIIAPELQRLELRGTPQHSIDE